MKLLYVLILFFLTSCGEIYFQENDCIEYPEYEPVGNHLHIKLSPSLPQETQGLLEDFFEDTGRELTFVSYKDTRWNINIRIAGEDHFKKRGRDNRSTRAVGYAKLWYRQCEVVLRRKHIEKYNNAYLEEVLYHEVAHCLGEGHVDDPDDIMNPYATMYTGKIGWNDAVKNLKDRLTVGGNQ